MPTRELKPSHEPIQDYSSALRQFDELGVSREAGVRFAFRSLLFETEREQNRAAPTIPNPSSASPVNRMGRLPPGYPEPAKWVTDDCI